MHIFADVTTGLALIPGTFGLHTKKTWVLHMYLTLIGMVVYTVIASLGYTADEGNGLFVGMFIIFLIVTIIVAVIIFVKEEGVGFQ
ncbi:hypothetical protein AYK25_06695 [Thermoplasmatales archaeon SM1-50]|nr:MAG: hypothetical protein AYK25_06695 [Thermoplasmatales archaeon SM1-50]